MAPLNRRAIDKTHLLVAFIGLSLGDFCGSCFVFFFGGVEVVVVEIHVVIDLDAMVDVFFWRKFPWDFVVFEGGWGS